MSLIPVDKVFQIIFLISMLTGATMLTCASQQQDEEIISGLVHSIAGEETCVAENKDSLRNDVIISVLNELSSWGALDFLSDAYESADFYASGKWSDDGKAYSSFNFTGRLPEFDVDDFIRPVDGGIMTSAYGYRETYHRLHKGVDISLNEGDVVRAALPGVIARIGYEPKGYGHFVILIHGEGMETRYAHLSRVTAVLGQRVNAGQDIAVGGSTGNSTGPHLHFEVRRHGEAVNPLSLFEM